MTKTTFLPGSAVLRARPLFELSDEGGEANTRRVKKPPAMIVLPAPAVQTLPFDSEKILEAVDRPRRSHLGSIGGLTNLSLELADFQDFVTETTAERLGQYTAQRLRLDSEVVVHDIVSSRKPLTSSRSSILLAPVKGPLQISTGTIRSRSAPRVAQKYQLRHPDYMITEASERRRIVNELQVLKSHPREKEESAMISKHEKEAGGALVNSSKFTQGHFAPTIKTCDLPFTADLLLLHHGTK